MPDAQFLAARVEQAGDLLGGLVDVRGQAGASRDVEQQQVGAPRSGLVGAEFREFAFAACDPCGDLPAGVEDGVVGRARARPAGGDGHVCLHGSAVTNRPRMKPPERRAGKRSQYGACARNGASP
ncbi:hypothetical protein B4N89_45305 [Embleya scabrispora]|uniref:Uncharacterized protein n=1 Tax=Embleya scabrispora TaxID=159449 RepID=A0A1T3NIN2_9ACTN|nr:hypothetical protein B4N89_45305 [Embleya scabrispora]